LPVIEDGNDIYTWVLVRLWDVLVHGKKGLQSTLTFPMISKLADYLLKNNPIIKKTLQVTYSHVFLDEFQDTTSVQYELVKTIFLSSSTIFTCVGDDKQRIMSWAGALPDSFERFKRDFHAVQIELTHNHRSAPRLIEIQNVFAKIINKNSINATVSSQNSDQEGKCEVWCFQSHIDEAVFVASSIVKRIQQENVTPRDICILVKQHEHIYAKAVIHELEKRGVFARIEKEYQDLLAEECVQIVLDFIDLATKEKSHDTWVRVSDMLTFASGYDPDQDHQKVLRMESELHDFLLQLRRDLNQLSVDEHLCRQQLRKIVMEIISFIGQEKLFRLYPKYARGLYFKELLNNAIKKLTSAFIKHRDWSNAIADFLGLYSVPIMTIHKSKGLEYDTVIFLGLEDDAFWSFQSQTHQDMCAFFVALSRAKTQCFFTFSKSREVLHFKELQVRIQSNNNISSLYQLLHSANVDIKNITDIKECLI
jgi:Superfamily I DNA and RNA helicases